MLQRKVKNKNKTERNNKMAKNHGFVGYNRGEEPNVPLQYLGMCCCGIPWILVGLGVYKAASEVLKGDFPESMGHNILCALFPIAGAIILDPILTKKEQELGIANAAPNMKVTGIVSFFCGLAAPLYMAGLIKRLNAIDAAANK